MDVLEALKTRRSVRQFQERPIPREVLEEIVDCARFAPTANNKQPWAFVVITDPQTRAAIAGLTDYGRFIANAPACIAVFCQETKYYLEDGSAATLSVLLAAWGRGIGSCWVAGDKKAYAEEVRNLLGVPAGYRLVSLIALGYPQSVPPARKRPLGEVLHWERF